jgi:hypothetical protein
VNAHVHVAIVTVSPFVTAFDAVRAAVARQLPDVDASQNDRCVKVSEPAAHVAHDGAVPFIDIEPADAAANVIATRVVFADAFDVAALPGSPVCSFTYRPDGAVNAVPRSRSRNLLAQLTPCRPTVMRTPQWMDRQCRNTPYRANRNSP